MPGLVGLTEFLESLPQLEQRRTWLQARRRRSDLDILGRFNQHWLSHSPAARQQPHDELQKLLVETFRIAEIAGIHATRQSVGAESASYRPNGRPALKRVP